MRFGAIPLADAEGALLAHGLKGDGFAFKKGRRLSAEDIARIAATGRRDVVAARLEADDVPEDAAAAAIAQAIAGENLVLSAAFTGRANLYATTSGLAAFDPARVDALNLVDEAITLATLPPLAPVAARQMVATVKIIPFAVPRPALDRALALAQGDAKLLRVAAYRPMRAALVQTTLPGFKPSVLANTVDATRARLAALGGSLAGDEVVAHEGDAVAAALRRHLESGVDLLLVLGASAVVDRRDVIPAAIERAGGRVEHFGMPVDPGNLLLFGALGATPVIGLPGCARSPKLNGFDWVLQRVAAGLPIDRRDIMRMGAGGLLSEIPSRPLPRQSAAPAPQPPRQPRIAAIVLAAGRSSRMAPANKLLVEIEGKPMVARAVDAALASQAIAVTVVVGNDAGRVRQALAGRNLTIVENPAFAEGLSASLRVGVAALPGDIDGVLVLLGDMPRVAAAHLDRLIAAFNPVEGRSICVPTHRAKRGNPILWDARFLPEMQALAGDQGARGLLGAHADVVCEVEMPDDGILLDVDTPAALAALAPAREQRA
ncbi:MAG: molybdopterin-binding/glycosyltransferase family 2 protein [Alphaproteobacteria bacterium]|nr:molybdopterin-binding/glycosyltransferase family 2 protein [Alphaproteobacteria bacterium]